MMVANWTENANYVLQKKKKQNAITNHGQSKNFILDGQEVTLVKSKVAMYLQIFKEVHSLKLGNR